MGTVRRQCLQVARATSRWATALAHAFTVQAGRGSSLTARLASEPVVAGGRVYTIDTLGAVRAFDAQTGGQYWASQTPVEERSNTPSLYGGGIAYDSGRIYATNGLGYVAALDAATGGIVWQVRPGGPLRGAPTVADGALYVMSQDNQIYSLKEADGATNWSQAASLEIAGVFGSAAPAVAPGHRRRRLLVGRAQRLSLRERPPGVAGRAPADQHPHQRRRRCRTSTPTRSSTAAR